MDEKKGQAAFTLAQSVKSKKVKKLLTSIKANVKKAGIRMKAT
jgi:hypothetical protein